MSATILKGTGSKLSAEPEATWKERLARAPEEFRQLLRFMSEDHHRVRYYAVEELPHRGRPLEPEAIAQAVGLPDARVTAILEELERKLFFVLRNEKGKPVPVTFHAGVSAHPDDAQTLSALVRTARGRMKAIAATSAQT